MKTVVISLPRSTERRARISELMAGCGIAFAFFDAIDGTEPDFTHSDRANPDLTFRRKGYRLKNGELACFASHYEVWRQCVAANDDFLVLEDNVDICSKATEIISLAAGMLPRYHLIKLAATVPSRFFKIDTLGPAHSIGVYKKATCGTTAYLVSPFAAGKLIENASVFIEPVDNYMEKPWRHGITAVHVHPSVFSRARIDTTIGKGRKLKNRWDIAGKVRIEYYHACESFLSRYYRRRFIRNSRRHRQI